jgi:hypothetical protein
MSIIWLYEKQQDRHPPNSRSRNMSILESMTTSESMAMSMSYSNDDMDK